LAADRSFKNYVGHRFYNELFNAVRDCLNRNAGRITTKSQQVRQVDQAWLSDIRVKHVFVEDQPGARIAFDVLVEADYEVSERDRRMDRYSEEADWFKVSCMGDLSRNLDDFTITGTEVYNAFGKQHNPLSGALVPIIRSEDLEDVAKNFVTQYYPEALRGSVAVNPYTLVERMGLTVQEKSITPDASIFGQIFFVDCEAEHYNIETGECEKAAVKGGTIFVDPANFFLRNLGSVYNTIVHECVHWHFHRKAFELERLYNEEATQIQCQVSGGVKKGTARSATDWMEWQANALAPRILMPFHATKIKTSEIIRAYLNARRSDSVIDVMESVIDTVATFFGVSRQAAKIRLYELGYEEAAGTFIYLDGRYVKPHTFKRGFLKPNQTFSISFRDAMVAGFFHPELREAIEQGLFLFVDSHFCINDPKYIAYDVFGNPYLTDYARYHMDECCLVFDLSLEASANDYQREFFFECVLCRDVNSEIVFVANYSELAQNQTVQERAKMMAAYNQEITNVLNGLPNSFPDALVELMRWRKVTVEGLAEAANVSPKTIQRLRNEPDYTSSLGTIVAVCIGLKLPPVLSRALIQRSGFSFRATETHVAYEFLLTGYYTSSIFDCNEMLIAQNIAPLGDIN
jgi:DNA-binding Xre family transcriptional regulator